MRPDLEEMMNKFDDPTKIKKSFEVKYQNDDDDEIFIVHEEDDQEQFFVQEPKQLAQSEQPSKSSEPINPFKDTLANSERLPSKLDVLINDNYMN